jgi:hypothetical protein
MEKRKLAFDDRTVFGTKDHVYNLLSVWKYMCQLFCLDFSSMDLKNEDEFLPQNVIGIINYNSIL